MCTHNHISQISEVAVNDTATAVPTDQLFAELKKPLPLVEANVELGVPTLPLPTVKLMPEIDGTALWLGQNT